MRKTLSLIMIVVVGVAALLFLRMSRTTEVFEAADGTKLRFELEGDDGVHFSLSKSDSEIIDTTVMIAPGHKPQRASYDRTNNSLETEKIRIEVDLKRACFQLLYKVSGYKTAEICPIENGITISAPEMQNVYGLGEQFLTPGKIDGDWVGKVRDSGTDGNPHNRGKPFGNNMTGYNGGAVGNAQFPIMYAVGPDKKNFALFFDNVHKSTWDFTAQPWKVETTGGELRGYIFTGPDLAHLRSTYMRLTGLPPVPPKKAFGLWISEFGFNNWQELDSKWASLKEAGFPVDGFVLDLYWFGGIKMHSEDSPMGGLNWDLTNFPDPKGKIAALKKDGLGLVVIEEAYISKGLPEHKMLADKRYLAMDGTGPDAKPTYLDYNSWWGKGGMLDYINGETARFWHDQKRQPLVDMEVTGHWTDLGEPEMFSPDSIYDGRFKHGEIHNIYNLKWSESIVDGYKRHNVARRPWILSRSGTSGSQRYGVALWSADIGSNLASLTTHINVQMHMSFSGLDYFGSDIGGFHRKSVDGDVNEMYTQWFAVGSLLDVPVRVHTENVSNTKETAPDRVGDKASNLFNIRQRYELNPYYYSLAHQAHLNGSPLVAPLIFFYQEDQNTRQLGDHKMIGPDLLTATVSAHKQRTRNVYLPKGVWYNFHTHAATSSSGQWLKDVSAYTAEGIFTLPLYAREGAILPMASSIRVYPSEQGSEFTWFDDDGETMAYASGKVGRTKIEQIRRAGIVRVTVGAQEGGFKSPANPAQIIHVVQSGAPHQVSVNGKPLPRTEDAAWDSTTEGWRSRDSIVEVKAPRNPASTMTVELSYTSN